MGGTSYIGVITRPSSGDSEQPVKSYNYREDLTGTNSDYIDYHSGSSRDDSNLTDIDSSGQL